MPAMLRTTPMFRPVPIWLRADAVAVPVEVDAESNDRSMMLPVPPEVGADHADPFLSPFVADQALPLEAEVGGVVAVDLDDQRLDVDLRAARVELVDHRAHLAVHRLGRGDDQRIGRRVGLDQAAGGGAGADRLVGAALCRGRGGQRGRPGAGRAGAVARMPPCPRWRRRRRCHRRRWWTLPREGGAQHVGELHRVGVLQVDDPDVAGRAAARRLVELLDQRLDRGSCAPGWRRARSASCCAGRRSR